MKPSAGELPIALVLVGSAAGYADDEAQSAQAKKPLRPNSVLQFFLVEPAVTIASVVAEQIFARWLHRQGF